MESEKLMNLLEAKKKWAAQLLFIGRFFFNNMLITF